MFSEGLLIGKRPFQDGAMPGKNYAFQRILPTSGYQNNYIRVGIQSVNPSIEPFCSLRFG